MVIRSTLKESSIEMSISRSVMLPFRYSRVGLLSHSKSTRACHRNTTVSPILNVPHAKATSSSSAVHFMGTWTDRIKKRWQSGNQSEESSRNSEGNVSQESKAESDGAEDENTSTTLQQTLQEKDSQIKANEEKLKDLQDKYLRALAEAENTRTRLMRQIEDAKKYGIQDFSKDVLEVADILDKAVESVPEDDLKGNPPLASLYEGLKLTEAELQKVMSKNGLQKIDSHDVDFDPSIHEALFEVPGDKHGTVAVVSRVGYLLHGRTVRPARVGVVKAPDS